MRWKEADRKRDREIRCSIDIASDPKHVLARWMRFEQLPQVLEGVRRVKRIAGERLLWDVDILGRQVVWEARIVAIEAGRSVAWESTWGALNAGELRVEALPGRGTRLLVVIRYQPGGLLERMGARLDLPGHQIRRDLSLFKRFLEREEGPPALLGGEAAAP